MPPVITRTRKKLFIVMRKLVQAAAPALISSIMIAQIPKMNSDPMKDCDSNTTSQKKSDIGELSTTILMKNTAINIAGTTMIDSPMMLSTLDLP